MRKASCEHIYNLKIEKKQRMHGDIVAPGDENREGRTFAQHTVHYSSKLRVPKCKTEDEQGRSSVWSGFNPFM